MAHISESNPMMDWRISNRVAGALWLGAGVWISHWFYRRKREAWRLLYDNEGSKPTPEEASDIRVGLIVQAFLCTGAWLLLFVLLDALF